MTRQTQAHITYGTPKVLLLQGPVGPFFRDLHRVLVAAGFEVRRVLFNAADRVFAPRQAGLTRFSGSVTAWDDWLRAELGHSKPDFMVLFGSMRPAHQVARKLADEFGVKVISLEEGYLRSGYITCETGGNNQQSPLCGWPAVQRSERNVVAAAKMSSSFKEMSFWGVIYYIVRDLFSKKSDEHLFHRKRESVFNQSLSWIGHISGRIGARLFEYHRLRRLTGELSGKYVLVTLQMPGDSQLKNAARGWSNEKLIKETLNAFKPTSDAQFVVFKIHPLDRKARKTTKLIKKIARELRLSERVIVLQTGAIGEVVQHSSGMIVINSTSGFSALHHNVPILVLGEAIYRHEALVTPGYGPASIFEFLKARTVKSSEHIHLFFDAVKSCALLPGDFYLLKGRLVAADAIADRLSDSLTSVPIYREAAE